MVRLVDARECLEARDERTVTLGASYLPWKGQLLVLRDPGSMVCRRLRPSRAILHEPLNTTAAAAHVQRER